MRKTCKFIAAAAAVLLAVLPMGSTLTASATTTDDVIAAAYAAGWPDWMVQQAINMYSGGTYTSEQCDKAIAQIYQYDESVAAQIEAQFGIAPPSNMPATSTAAPENAGSTETTVTTTTEESRPSDKEFLNMTLDEKKDYLNSMPAEDKEEFVNTMTDAERNSVLKQLSASDKAAIISSFVEVGEEFGITFNIDELSGDDLQISARDEEGKLVNVTSMGITIDPTGHSYTVPIAAGAGLLLVSVGGLIFLVRRRSQED